jgi:hypothetical protein
MRQRGNKKKVGGWMNGQERDSRACVYGIYPSQLLDIPHCPAKTPAGTNRWAHHQGAGGKGKTQNSVYDLVLNQKGMY